MRVQWRHPTPTSLVFVIAVAWGNAPTQPLEQGVNIRTYVPNRIPNVVHQVLPPLPPDELVSLHHARVPRILVEKVETILSQNHGWKFRFWHDDEIESMAENLPLPEHTPYHNLSWYFHRISPAYGAARGDVLRLAIIWNLGGVYFDTKSGPAKPFAAWLPKGKLAYTQWSDRLSRLGWGVHDSVNTPNHREFVNWFIAAPAHHPLIQGALLHVLSNLRSPPPGSAVSGKSAVWELTGPIAYTNGVVATPEWKSRKGRRRLAKHVPFDNVQYEVWPRVISVYNRNYNAGRLESYRDVKSPVLQLD
eukprot:m.11131 g.11131  ORF g.11131 m.11131 type:complete len:305 (+) comp4399_c0_seq1:175-1089(+)